MNNLKTALENAMQKDVERYERLGGEHEFSGEFERNMERLAAPKKRPRLRIVKVVAAAAAAMALFSVGTLAGAVSSGFNVGRALRYGKPAKVFTAVDTEGCPTSIETAYVLGGFPEELMSVSQGENYVSATYFPAPLSEVWNDELYFAKAIFLTQETKERFKFQYADMDYVTYKTLTVNGGQAYYIARERYYGVQSYLFWESEDYIFTLSGGLLSEERAIELAGTLAVYDGEIREEGQI